jgi:methionyl-tRNA synthetase
MKEQLSWADAGNAGLIKGGYKLNKPTLLFEKIEDEIINAQLEKLNKNKANMEQQPETENSIKPQKPEITLEDFEKLDFRIGTILTAEKVEKADKLLKLTVDLGFEVRTIVSGIAEHFNPEELPGKQVTVVANLAPRKIRGVESKGMIMLAEKADGKLEFATVLNSVPNGSIVR